MISDLAPELKADPVIIFRAPQEGKGEKKMHDAVARGDSTSFFLGTRAVLPCSVARVHRWADCSADLVALSLAVIVRSPALSELGQSNTS